MVKRLTKYQIENTQSTQREFPCGMIHASIEEAIVHAKRGLGIERGSGLSLKPYLGTMRFGGGVIVGWQTEDGQKRFRLDYAHNFEEANAFELARGTGIDKGTLGIHVNEEDFTRTARTKVCHPTEASLLRAEGYGNKWSREFGLRGSIVQDDLKTKP